MRSETKAMNSTDHQTPATTLVVGLGMTGLSAVRHLLAKRVGVAVADVAPNPSALQQLQKIGGDVEIRSGEFDAQWFRGFSNIVVSPGVRLDSPAIVAAIDAGADVFGDIELYARNSHAPLLATTGSNGKSTVVAMLGDVLNACNKKTYVGGNIGVPALDLLDGDAADSIHALELSSFQLEATDSLKPLGAALLNISADHMDRYVDVDAYLAAKARIFSGAVHAILNRDDDRVGTLQQSLQVDRCISFGVSAPTSAADYGIIKSADEISIVRGEQNLLDVSRLQVSGQHNFLNVMAVLALAECVGVDPLAAAEAACSFTGLAHRMEFIGEWSGVRWVNDSKGTNVGATVAAVTGSDRPVVLIAGGMAKQDDFSELSLALGRRARAVVLMGRDASLMEEALQGVAVFRVDSIEQAIEVADSIAVAGDSVLLSPACASFDMFDNFAHRGDVFKQLVQQRFVS